MSRDFSISAATYLENTNAVLTTTPISMACWFNSDDVSNYQVPLSISNKTSATAALHYLTLNGALAQKTVGAFSSADNDWAGASTTTEYSVSTWHHVTGVWASATDRRAYLDGEGKGTDSTPRTPTGLDNTSLGIYWRNSIALSPMDGRVAEVAVWNVALTDADAAALGAGFSPRLVRPDALVAYWPLIGRSSPEPSPVGGYDMTLVGSVPQASHPRIIYPSHGQNYFVPAAAAGGGVEIFRRRIEGHA